MLQLRTYRAVFHPSYELVNLFTGAVKIHGITPVLELSWKFFKILKQVLGTGFCRRKLLRMIKTTQSSCVKGKPPSVPYQKTIFQWNNLEEFLGNDYHFNICEPFTEMHLAVI